jgi:hypothetical protein
MAKIDLHLHTSYSDGVFSPRELLEMLQQYDYDLVAITDHDTIDGCLVGLKLAPHYDIRMISGVEISTDVQGRDVHILSYGFDTNNKPFRKLLQEIEKGRMSRAHKIVKLLAKQGMKLDFKEVINLTGKFNLVGRPHIARALIDAGHCHDIREVFDNYIGEGQSCYIPKRAPTAPQVLEAISKAGGISVLAHPYIYHDDEMIETLISQGLEGLEVYYSRHTPEETQRYETMAEHYGLIMTGGSDFHGHGSDMNFFGFFSAPAKVAEKMEHLIKVVVL